ncbi:efflux RND transporter permease subunit [Aquabacter sp. L1I39]|uniref:efflux RND transporter permease subunit n=1 Tax=Aquabacter sp. L1I39 TaxID=2820278 RepID=UPI001ADA2DBC|nr:efflux RND transporter permease subunit [Aquabacter sp. L1I39]QTL04464.1 efflux RND transporter permease subunit [Aquabacter sp. L1I39]
MSDDASHGAPTGGFNLSRLAITHRALTLFAILLVAAAGVFAYFNLGRAEDPSFTIKVMVVSAVWPGATSTQMQELVADPIEKKLQSLAHLERVETYSRPGVSFIQVTLKDSTPASDVKPLWYQVRKKVDDMKDELPSGVVGPFFDDEYGDVYSNLYMLSGDQVAPAELKRQAEIIRQKLRRVPGVQKVDIIGERPERIYIEFSHARLATLGITPQQVFDAVARQNAVVSGGAVDTKADRINLRLSGAFSGPEAIAAVPVAAGNAVFRLGDIATVRRGYEDPASFLIRQNGRDAVGIGVTMEAGENIITWGEDVKAAMDKAIADLPVGIDVTQVADQPHIVSLSVGEFLRTFAEALVIVLVVSFLSLGWRTGIVVALSVPLVLAIVFVVMLSMDMDLHRITLGALIIALGLLVDDAIIAIEMMVVKMEEGFDRASAATFAWSSTAFPMLTGTLVTAAGFLPVGFAKSSSGEYAGGIFWVVGIALIASWFVAVIFTPYLGYMLLPDFKKKAGAGGHGGHDLHDGRLYRLLRGVLGFCLRRRFLVIGVTFGLFALSVVGFGAVQQQFFPTSTRSELFLQMRLPEGTSISVTEATARKAEALFAGDPDVVTATTYVGQGTPRFWLGLNPVLPNPNFAEIVIVTKDTEARDRLKDKLDADIAEGALSEARARVDRFVFGPPVGFPVQFRVVGPDPILVRQIAEDVRTVVARDPAVIDPHLNWGERVKSITLEVDQDRARAIGLTSTDMAQTLQTLLSGYTVTQHREGNLLIDVVARAVPEERIDLEKLATLTVGTRNGVAVPLGQVARILYATEEPILWRRDRDLVLTVRADIKDGVQAPDVTARILPNLSALKAGLPTGYRVEVGGSVEESAKANKALAAVFPLMIITMLSILMVQLQSFSRLALVLVTAPLGLIGATAALLVSHQPFGFVALLGLIALAGMIMRNTVILVDQIDTDIAAGHAPAEAIVDATLRRARPVVLTALAAVLGMIPLTHSVFWGPMAITIMGGLLVATVLTLVSVPAMYAAWFRVKLGAPAPAVPAAAAAQPPAVPAAQ